MSSAPFCSSTTPNPTRVLNTGFGFSKNAPIPTKEIIHKLFQTETIDIETQKQCEALLNEFEEHLFKNNDGKIFICPRLNVKYLIYRLSEETVRIGVVCNGETVTREIAVPKKLQEN